MASTIKLDNIVLGTKKEHKNVCLVEGMLSILVTITFGAIVDAVNPLIRLKLVFDKIIGVLDMLVLFSRIHLFKGMNENCRSAVRSKEVLVSIDKIPK